MPGMQEFMDFVVDLYDDDETKWTKHRSFYISMNAMVEFDFSDDAKTVKIPGQDWINDMLKTFTKGDKLLEIPKMSEHAPLIFGRVIDFKPRVHELKVFHGKTEIHDEADDLNRAIMDA
jgi:hypothetical protein